MKVRKKGATPKKESLVDLDAWLRWHSRNRSPSGLKRAPRRRLRHPDVALLRKLWPKGHRYPPLRDPDGKIASKPRVGRCKQGFDEEFCRGGVISMH